MSAVRRLKVLGLLPYRLDEAPGQRYRIEQWTPYLAELGIDVHLDSFADPALQGVLYRQGHFALKAWHMTRAWARRARTTRRVGSYDAVYLYREASLIGPAVLERVVRRLNPRIVFDFDDAIWQTYASPRNGYLAYLKALGKTATLCRGAAAVTVGNETLAEYARHYNRAVTVVPSTVSLRRYRARPAGAGGGAATVGWTGSHSSAQYLRLVEGALRRLAKDRRFRLRVVGVTDYRLDGVEVESLPWRSASEVEDLWPMDVGIMPLFDDAWTRGKCAMKAIQYGGVGVPAVVSPVGANAAFVDHGATGFHARSEDEWVAALQRLLDDPSLRGRMGQAARRKVEHEYAAESQVPRFAAVLRSVAG